jgi:hypothetical protein
MPPWSAYSTPNAADSGRNLAAPVHMILEQCLISQAAAYKRAGPVRRLVCSLCAAQHLLLSIDRTGSGHKTSHRCQGGGCELPHVPFQRLSFIAGRHSVKARCRT